jgi:UDP-glucuronate 4-epimerase
MTILVTGAAGFIGYHLCRRLIHEGERVVGIDNFNSYYDPNLKNARIKELNRCSSKTQPLFQINKVDLEDAQGIKRVFSEYRPKKVVNLAAQAGVRYSIDNPSAYVQSNLVGFFNVLEACRNSNIEHLVYASSSSVYGGNSLLPFSERQNVDHPVSLYAATKKSNELMAHAYSHLFGLPTTGLRFFTVYGPWGRPDMALFRFTESILEGRPIQIYNYGKMIRDFTYIDDIIESLVLLLNKPAEPDSNFDKNHPDPGSSWAPYKVFNIGNSQPIQLLDYIKTLEMCIGRSALKDYTPIQPGDVPATSADVSELYEWIQFRPNTSVEKGIHAFVSWYRGYYGK